MLYTRCVFGVGLVEPDTAKIKSHVKVPEGAACNGCHPRTHPALRAHNARTRQQCYPSRLNRPRYSSSTYVFMLACADSFILKAAHSPVPR